MTTQSTRAITVTNDRTLASVVKAAERLACKYSFVTAEHHGGDTTYYHVVVHVDGADDALALLDLELTRTATLQSG